MPADTRATIAAALLPAVASHRERKRQLRLAASRNYKGQCNTQLYHALARQTSWSDILRNTDLHLVCRHLVANRHRVANDVVAPELRGDRHQLRGVVLVLGLARADVQLDLLQLRRREERGLLRGTRPGRWRRRCPEPGGWHMERVREWADTRVFLLRGDRYRKGEVGPPALWFALSHGG